MTAVLLTVAAWLLLSVVAGVVVGRGIRLADEEQR